MAKDAFMGGRRVGEAAGAIWLALRGAPASSLASRNSVRQSVSQPVIGRDLDRTVGGVAATIEGLHHRVPGTWLHRYYRLQAGYSHEHYGGHFFGPAINILPTDSPTDPELYPSQWLNSGLVAYRTEL